MLSATKWASRPADQGFLERLHIGGPFDQAVQGLFADLRAGVAQQFGDGVQVVASGDGVTDRLAQVLAPGDRAQGPLHRLAGDDFLQVLVGQDGREFQHRSGNDQFRVEGQLADHVGRGVGDLLQAFGDDLANRGHLVPGQQFQRLVGHLADGVLLEGGQSGGQLGDFLGHADADFLVVVSGQQQVGLARGGVVFGDGPAHLWVFVLSQEIENFGLDVVTTGQFPAHAAVGVAGQFPGLFIGDGPVALQQIMMVLVAHLFPPPAFS